MACTFSERPDHYNFAAGPSTLPAEVLAQIRDQLPDWRGSGCSVMEQPFTAAPFKQLMAEVENDLRTLLDIPEPYRVLFMQGGASAQFGLLPINLLQPGQSADYLETGHWARKAITEARRHAAIRIVASGQPTDFTSLPVLDHWRLDPQAGYCHVTSNETGNGLQMQDFPDLQVPLVADMTSDLLTRPVPVERFGLIYAAAQKNLGVAGLCLVIVRADLLRAPAPGLPSAFSYAVLAEQQSRFNTPPTFAIHVAGLMLRWIARQGGLAAMAVNAWNRSQLLYRHIDQSGFYQCPQEDADRSRVNVCFRLSDARLLDTFIDEAARNGLHNLAGHSNVGGIRASLYNAMPLAGAQRLLDFMKEFEARHG